MGLYDFFGVQNVQILNYWENTTIMKPSQYHVSPSSYHALIYVTGLYKLFCSTWAPNITGIPVCICLHSTLHILSALHRCLLPSAHGTMVIMAGNVGMENVLLNTVL